MSLPLYFDIDSQPEYGNLTWGKFNRIILACTNMAVWCKSVFRLLAMKPSTSLRYLNKSCSNKLDSRVPFVALLVAGGTVALYTGYQCQKGMLAYQPKIGRAAKLTPRERRFIRFASVGYDGQLYMTPQDFLESVVVAEPRPRLKIRTLTAKDMEYIKANTPSVVQDPPKLFTNLRNKGIISYAEYLFLLSVLTKPQSGFRIAFNMFDTDGNQRVDKSEFLVISKVLAGKRKKDSETMEKINSRSLKGKRGLAIKENSSKAPSDEYVDDELGFHAVDTTLIIHFFGPQGREELRFEGFRRFMLELQTEVLEFEFSEFAQGFPTISEEDFAKILLRYTYLDPHGYDTYLDRLVSRIKKFKGITFEEFYIFCQFLNNLEDFSIAVRMHTLADQPISKDEFHRAVKICTGTSLSQHLVHTIFAIFDEDGDGLLSYREFIAIMKDRRHRGFKSHATNEGWGAFKKCMKQAMKTPI